ncbi:MAG: cation:proton antiporter, partial [Gluconacetobacter liquefaciens]
VLGWGGLWLIRRLRDSDLVITATVLLAATSYIGADRLHVSGVLATVTTGLILGWNQHADFSASTRVRGLAFWKVMVFLLQSVLFILIGLSLRGVLHRLAGTTDLLHHLVIPIAAILGTMIVSRFVWLFGADAIRAVLRRWWPRHFAAPSLPETIIMGWSGMRGVVTLAAALSLPESLPGRDLALCCAFAAILVTVLLQGITLEPLVHALNVTDDDAATTQANENVAWVRMAEAQLRAVEQASRRPDGTERHPRLLEQYRYRLRVTRDYAHDMSAHRPEEIAHYEAVLAAIRAARTEILALYRQGQLHDHVLREMEQDLDMQEITAEGRL